MAKRIKTLAIISILAVWVLLLAATGFAVSPNDYRTQLERSIERLNYMKYEDVNFTDEQARQHQRYLISQIKQFLPQEERVEFGPTTIEIDNKWFYARLEEFEKPDLGLDVRNNTARELSERLTAIKIKLDEIERAVKQESTKIEDKQKLEEILNRPEYAKPVEKEESFLERKMRELMEWLENLLPKPKLGTSPSPALFQGISGIVQIVVVALVLAFIGFLVYKFAPLLKRRLGNREKPESKTRVILGETLAETDTSDDLFAEAERLARQGNLRGALRKGYIALLCELSDKKIIGLARHKTNRDYLRDVRKKSDLHGGMTTATNSFERHWYGSSEAQEDDWKEFKEVYRQTLSKV